MRMHGQIVTQRHYTVRNFIANLPQLSVLAILSELTPFGQIQGLAAFVHVIRDQPGNRRDVRVPGPDGLVGMTITARPFKDGRGLRRHLRPRKNRLRFVDRWVRSCRADELNAEKNNDQDNGDPFQDSKYDFHVCCLCSRRWQLRMAVWMYRFC